MSDDYSFLSEELTLLAVAVGLFLVRTFDKTTATIIQQFLNNTQQIMSTILVQDAIFALASTPPSSEASAQQNAENATILQAEELQTK